MATAGVAYIELRAKLDEFRRDLERAEKDSTSKAKSIGQKFSDAGSKAMDVGKKMTTRLTLPIVAGFGLAANAASDLNESMSKVDVVFGKSAQEIQTWSKTSAAAMGISRQEALESVGTFGNLFTAMEIGQKPAADMSKNLVQLASDLASFNNADPKEVLENLRAGLMGEAEPMRKFGVQLSAVRIQQEALNMGLAKSVEELTAADKAQAAYQIMLDDTKTAQGDFARTSDGMANKQRIATAQFKDAAATLGNQLLPIGQKVLAWVGTLAEKFNALSPQTQKVILVIGGLTAAAGPATVAFGALAKTIGFLSGALSFLSVTALRSAASTAVIWTMYQVEAVKAAAVHVAAVGRQVAAWALLGAQSLVHAAKVAAAWLIAMGPIALVVAAVVGLAAVVIKNWDTIKEWTSKTFKAVAEVIGNVWNGIKNAFGEGIAFILKLVRGFLNVWITVAGGIVDAAAKAFGWVPGIGDKIQKFRDQFHNTTDSILNQLDRQINRFEGWGEKSRKEINKTNDEFNKLVSTIRNTTGLSNLQIQANITGDGPGRGGKAAAWARAAIAAVPGAQYITSTYRTPAQNAAVGGSPTSYHLDRNNPAVDIAGENLGAIADYLRRFGPRELLWNVPGHYDHVHVADMGARIRGPALVRIGNITEDVQFIPRTGRGAVPEGGVHKHYHLVVNNQQTAMREKDLQQVFTMMDLLSA